MKKILVIFILVLMVTVLAVGPASAQNGKININGQVSAIAVETSTENGTLTVETKKDGPLVVTMPEDFDFTTIAVDDWVLIKAHDEDGTVVADFVKQVGARGKKGKPGDADPPEGSKDNSAFCSGDKQVKSHPLALKIAERYGVPEGEFMEYFCDGYSVGAIMLALKTSQLDGSGDPDALLALRGEGEPWGHIWKEGGLIGKDKAWDTPPGHLKRPDHAGGQDLD